MRDILYLRKNLDVLRTTINKNTNILVNFDLLISVKIKQILNRQVKTCF